MHDLTTTFRLLDVRHAQPSREKVWFDSFRVTNSLSAVRRILQESPDLGALVNNTAHPGGAPVLLIVCEEGPLEVVDFLLGQEPDLEAKDSHGKTALLAAADYGYGQSVCRLVDAGARIDVRDSNGQSFREKVSKVLRSQREYLGWDIRFDGVNNNAGRSHRQKREREISALQSLVEYYAIHEAQAFTERQRRTRCDIYGLSQAEQFMNDCGITRRGTICHMLQGISATPTSNIWKTVACLVRGTALPYTLAVSGYAVDLYGGRDGALDRPRWMKMVFRLASLVDHTLPVHQHDVEDHLGSYFACHTEKQLLAFALWTHSTMLADAEQQGDLGVCETPSLSMLPMEIFIGRPAQETAYVCDDCAKFCGKLAGKLSSNLSHFVVDRDGVTTSQSWQPSA